MKRYCAALFLLWALAGPTHALDDAATRNAAARNAAVLDFSAKNVDEVEASIFTDLLRTELVRGGWFTLLDKSHMDELLAEAVFQYQGYTDQTSVVKAGRILNVGKIVTGTLARVGESRFVTVHLVDVETGRIDRSEILEFDRDGDLPRVAHTLAERLSGKSYEPAVPEKKEPWSRREPRRFGLGIGNRFYSLVIAPSEHFAIEPHLAALPGDDDNKMLGVRVNITSNRDRFFYGSVALETDHYANYEYHRERKQYTSSGQTFGAFAGIGFRITNWLTLAADAGQVYFSTIGGNPPQEPQGIVNAGLYLFLF